MHGYNIYSLKNLAFSLAIAGIKFSNKFIMIISQLAISANITHDRNVLLSVLRIHKVDSVEILSDISGTAQAVV
ncbi:hypothetical protein WA1_12580 [Scytonema hofmannii PCC 7110]|uniref:Uncharacterized protein n=1 Tax=Scytonema hofmannii PCC 7110 TaxID=128403 RepID=A0A139XE12_9CYAN|nr:hypothetical protein WA1_12580 [Scytonema hofmannii PCC 7110]